MTRLRLPDIVLAAAALVIGVAAVAVWMGRGHAFLGQAGGRVTMTLLALLAALVAAALWLPWERRTRLALMLGSTAMALLAAELAVRPRPTERLRTALQRLRRSHPEAVPNISPAYFRRPRPGSPPHALTVEGRTVFPLASVSRTLTLDCREGDGWVTYTTDEHGFRNPPALWGAPAEVVLVGDSFAHGQCVQEGHTLADRLRARYPATVSLGHSGNGPLTALAGLRESLSVLRPRVVLWLYFSGNDLWDLRQELDHPILRRYFEEEGFNQGILDQQPAVDAALRRVIERRIREEGGPPPSPWVDLLLLRHLRSHIVIGPPGSGAAQGPQFGNPFFSAAPRDLRAFASLLRRARGEVERGGARLVFVYLPAWTELLPPRPDERIVRGLVLKAVREVGLPVVDVLDAFARSGDPAALFACRRTCHYNARGYALAADHVMSALASRAELAQR